MMLARQAGRWMGRGGTSSRGGRGGCVAAVRAMSGGGRRVSASVPNYLTKRGGGTARRGGRGVAALRAQDNVNRVPEFPVLEARVVRKMRVLFEEGKHASVQERFIRFSRLHKRASDRMFVILIRSYVSAGCLTDARKLLRSAPRQYGIEGGLEKGYVLVIQAHASAGDVTSAISVLDQMKRAGVKQTVATYGAILQAQAKVGDVKGGEVMMERMVANGIEPDSLAFAFLARGYAEKGEVEGVDGVAERALERGLAPDPMMLNARVQARIVAGDVSGARAVMEENFVLADHTTIAQLVAGYCKAGDLEKAEELAFGMLVRDKRKGAIERVEDKAEITDDGDYVRQERATEEPGVYEEVVYKIVEKRERVSRFDESKTVLERLPALAVFPSRIPWHKRLACVADALLEHGYLPQKKGIKAAELLLVRMAAAQIKPAAATFDLARKVCEASGDRKLVKKLHEKEKLLKLREVEKEEKKYRIQAAMREERVRYRQSRFEWLEERRREKALEREQKAGAEKDE